MLHSGGSCRFVVYTVFIYHLAMQENMLHGHGTVAAVLAFALFSYFASTLQSNMLHGGGSCLFGVDVVFLYHSSDTRKYASQPRYLPSWH